jgi:hypothetical protein
MRRTLSIAVIAGAALLAWPGIAGATETSPTPDVTTTAVVSPGAGVRRALGPPPTPAATRAAALPTANLTFLLSIPAEHLSATTVTAGKLAVGAQYRTTCAVHSSGPNKVTGLNVRLFGLTTDPAAWDLRLAPAGPVIGGGTLVPIGSLASGQTKTVTFYLTPKRVGIQLTTGCNVDPVPGETLNEPPFDRAGDYGAALRLMSTAVAPTPTPSASSTAVADPSASAPGAGLASTGTQGTRTLTATGGGLVLAGAVILLAFRRRPRGAHQ